MDTIAFERVVFDASAISFGEVLYSILKLYLLMMSIPLIMYLLSFREKDLAERRRLVKSYVLSGGGVISLFFALIVGLAVGEYQDYKNCTPFLESKCPINIGKIIDLQKRSTRASFKTEDFKLIASERDQVKHTFSGKQINKLNLGECLYTVHSPTSLDDIFFAAVISCEEQRLE